MSEKLISVPGKILRFPKPCDWMPQQEITFLFVLDLKYFFQWFLYFSSFFGVFVCYVFQVTIPTNTLILKINFLYYRSFHTQRKCLQLLLPKGECIIAVIHRLFYFTLISGKSSLQNTSTQDLNFLHSFIPKKLNI